MENVWRRGTAMVIFDHVNLDGWMIDGYAELTRSLRLDGSVVGLSDGCLDGSLAQR